MSSTVNSWLDALGKLLSGLFGRAPAPPPDDSLKTLTPRVLVLVFDPIIDAATGQRLSQSRYAQGWNSVDYLIDGYIGDIEKCSGGLVKFHEVNRQLVEGFPLRMSGQRYDAASFTRILDGVAPVNEQDLMNYPALIDQLDLASRAANDEFDEVWMFGFPFAGFSESRMVGAGAFDCNGDPIPIPGRRFVIMGFNYQRGVGEMLEDLGHRAERVLAHLFGSMGLLGWAYDKNRNPPVLDASKVAGLNPFERYILFNQIAPGKANVGLLHFAPNSIQEYQWDSLARVSTCCDDWYLYPNLPAPPHYRTVTCAEWGGEIRGHHKFWLDHLPKAAGRTNGILNNWWTYFIRVDGPYFDPR